MRTTNETAVGSTSLTLLKRVIEMCDRFEADWRTACPAPLEHYLETALPHDRPAVLHRLLCLEIELRRARGEQPTEEEYLGRFPEERALDLLGVPRARLDRCADGRGGDPHRNQAASPAAVAGRSRDVRRRSSCGVHRGSDHCVDASFRPDVPAMLAADARASGKFAVRERRRAIRGSRAISFASARGRRRHRSGLASSRSTPRPRDRPEAATPGDFAMPRHTGALHQRERG